MHKIVAASDFAVGDVLPFRTKDVAQVAIELVKLDEALEALASLDRRKGRVVDLRFFSCLSLQETAEALGVSGKTVMRDWEFAKAWLQREMARDRQGV